ncbi:hypothetical protein Pelo_11664 [Pelomyxa schiedti]|nr:hypothetical protein Pelo_11664 [Pelomyxa schiedti]
MGQQHPHQQPHLQMDPRVTTTTAKSQALALLCAPVVAKRSPPPPTPPAPSLVRWAQSTSLARAWARDWVVRPAAHAVFQLPIRGHRLCASVSPTLGLVSSRWFRQEGKWGAVRGCVGQGRVLACSMELRAGVVVREYRVEDVAAAADGGDDGGRAPSEVLASLGRLDCLVWCNSKWIVGLPSRGEMCVWKVLDPRCDGGAGLVLSEEQRFEGVDATLLQFSPLCDDDVMAFSSALSFVEFIDLEASFNSKNVVVKSVVKCSKREPFGILWMPDGSTCSLHYGYSSCIILKDTATGNPVKLFPKCVNHVIPVGSHHIFVMGCPATEFQVYSTKNLTTPSLCTPCTWAAASLPSGLIVSTSHDQLKYRKTSDIQFELHDGGTGFHIGGFRIPTTDPVFFSPDESSPARTLHHDPTKVPPAFLICSSVTPSPSENRYCGIAA